MTSFLFTSITELIVPIGSLALELDKLDITKSIKDSVVSGKCNEEGYDKTMLDILSYTQKLQQIYQTDGLAPAILSTLKDLLLETLILDSNNLKTVTCLIGKKPSQFSSASEGVYKLLDKGLDLGTSYWFKTINAGFDIFNVSFSSMQMVKDLFRDDIDKTDTYSLIVRSQLLQPVLEYPEPYKIINPSEELYFSWTDELNPYGTKYCFWIHEEMALKDSAENCLKAMNVFNFNSIDSECLDSLNDGYNTCLGIGADTDFFSEKKYLLPPNALEPDKNYIWSVFAVDDDYNYSQLEEYRQLTTFNDEVETPSNTSTPIAHWKFESSSTFGTEPDVVNNHDGFIFGDIHTQHGIIGNSGSFDGSGDYIQISPNLSELTGSSFTVATWINVHSLPNFSTSNSTSIFTNDIHCRPQRFMVTDPGTGKARVAFSAYTGCNEGDSARAEIDLNKWYYTAATYDNVSGELMLYVFDPETDELTTNTTTMLDDLEPWTGSVKIGGNNRLNRYFDGKLDEMMVFDKALSKEELEYFYNAHLNGDSGYQPPDDPVSDCDDNDQDGYYAQLGCSTPVDCDDKNSDVYPGAEELCYDGIDNDCDGIKDCDVQICTDDDADGYYAEEGCSTPVDCDDRYSQVYPYNTEDCSDGLDNDCDGYVDCDDAECGSIPTDIKLWEPGGGDAFVEGDANEMEIEWEKEGDACGTVTIELSVDGKNTWTTIHSSVAGTFYRWEVGDVLNERSDDCYIRVTSNGDPSISDTNNTPFTIFNYL